MSGPRSPHRWEYDSHTSTPRWEQRLRCERCGVRKITIELEHGKGVFFVSGDGGTRYRGRPNCIGARR